MTQKKQTQKPPNIDYGHIVRKRRELLGFSQGELAKPGIDAALISRVENNSISYVSDYALNEIAKSLQTKPFYLKDKKDYSLRVCMGFTTWALPLYYIISKKIIREGLSISFFSEGPLGNPVFITEENIERIDLLPAPGKSYLTAPQIKTLCAVDLDCDLIFCPKGLYDYYKLKKIGSIMSTVSGGLSYLIITNKNTKFSEADWIVNIKAGKNIEKILFHPDSIAQSEADNYLNYKFFDQKRTKLHPINFNDPYLLTEEINNLEIQKDAAVILVGWEPHLTIVTDNIFPNKKTIPIEAWQLRGRMDPLPQISFDIVTRENATNLCKSEQYNFLMQNISAAINELYQEAQKGSLFPFMQLAKILNLEGKEEYLTDLIKKTSYKLDFSDDKFFNNK